jgi:hypothetical protein
MTNILAGPATHNLN